jgi:hypothetical protein
MELWKLCWAEPGGTEKKKLPSTVFFTFEVKIQTTTIGDPLIDLVLFF